MELDWGVVVRAFDLLMKGTWFTLILFFFSSLLGTVARPDPGLDADVAVPRRPLVFNRLHLAVSRHPGAGDPLLRLLRRRP